MFGAVQQRSHVRSLPPRHIHHQHTCQSHSAEAKQSDYTDEEQHSRDGQVEKVGLRLFPETTSSTGKTAVRLRSLATHSSK